VDAGDVLVRELPGHLLEVKIGGLDECEFGLRFGSGGAFFERFS
jgi:hypothetical protein